MTRARLCDWVLRLAWDGWVPGNTPDLVDLTCLLTISISSFVSCLFILLACLLTRLFDFFFVCVQVGWGQHWASSFILPFLSLRQHPSVNVECVYSARLASQWTPKVWCLHFSCSGVSDGHCHTWLLCRYQGPERRSLCTAGPLPASGLFDCL